MNVHPTAIIDPLAKIHPSCKIGPYCVIGPQVQLGEGCHLVSHVTMEGPSKIGADNGFFPFSSIGLAPQDITYAGEPTQLEIGDHNEIREFVTINEPFFAGHFPNLPIMPGVLIVEAIAQAGGALLLTEVEDRADKLMVFTGIERARFRRPVVPGDQLRIEVEVKAWRVSAVRMEGKVFVGDKRVAEATVTCQLVDRSRTRPEAAEAEPEGE